MSSIKISYTLPEELVSRFHSQVPKGRRSAFLRAAIKKELGRIEGEALRQELIEGYKARAAEDLEINREWESAASPLE